MMNTSSVQRLLLLSILAVSAAHCSRQTVAPPCAVRFTIPPPPDAQFSTRQIPALSPDGSRVAFTAVGRDGVPGLWVQSLRRSVARLVSGTAGATLPFWSPDGERLGFFADRRLKWVDLRSGELKVLAEVSDARGGSWGAKEVIIFAGSAPGIFGMSPNGGALRQVTNRENAADVVDSWPTFLVDGEHFLYSSIKNDKRHVFLGSTRSSEQSQVFEGIGSPVASVGPGFLLFAGGDDDILLRVRFDPKLFEVEQPLALVAQAVARGAAGLASFTASADGTTVVYGQGGRQIVWLDAAGRETVAIPDPGSYQFPILSPSGEEILVTVGAHWLGAGSGLYYVYQTTTDQWRLLSDGAGGLRHPLWAAGGKEVIFTQQQDRTTRVVALRADGSGATRTLFDASPGTFAAATARTGGLLALVISQAGLPGTRLRVVSLSVGGSVEDRTVWSTTTAGNKSSPAFSPDGRVLAYVSDESGADEVYVSQLDTPAAPVRVSAHGGSVPSWSGDGRQLFYRNRSGIVAVATHGIPSSWGRHERIHLRDEDLRRRLFGDAFTVSRDGTRFLMLQQPDPDKPAPLIGMVACGGSGTPMVFP